MIYRDVLIHKEFTPSTVNNRLSALASLFDHLVAKQLMSLNPVKGVKRQKEKYDKVKSLRISNKHIRIILNLPDIKTLQCLRDSAILGIFFYTGCRISESCHLNIKIIKERL